MEGKRGSSNLGSLLREAQPYLLMVGLELGFAGTGVFCVMSMKHGMNRFVFNAYRNAFAAISLAPFAFFLERKVRPKMTFSVFLMITALGFLEPVVDQGFTLLGMEYTSATFASATQNAVPSMTFILAAIFRLERVKMKEAGSKGKVIGTVVSFGGALLMTLYKGPVINLFHHSCANTLLMKSSHEYDDHKHHHYYYYWLIGTLFLLLGCLAWSSFFILQSITVNKYPAEMSLACLICLVGSVQSGGVALVFQHHSAAWSLGWDYTLFAPLYTGLVSSGIAYYIQGLVLKTKGPVFVTAFNPLCMLILAPLASFFLSEQFHLGSIIGAIIVAVGLYCVVWGKAKDEDHSQNNLTLTVLPMPSSPTAAASTHHLPITNTHISKMDSNINSAAKPIYHQPTNQHL